MRLVDSEGRPIVLARVGTHAQFYTPSDGLGPEWTYFNQVISGEDGIARFENRDDISGWLIARHYGRRLVAFEKVTPYRLATGPITLTMQPECRVFGRLTCRELERRKRDLGWTNVYLHVEGRGPSLGCASEEQTFHFFAPPGSYTLEAYGMKLHTVHKTIVVKPGQRELQVDPIELPAKRLGLLEGMPAPELSEVAAWKNSPPLKLTDLRGKCVLLEFWGAWCGPCIRGMPGLFELYDKYHREGLVIIGVHVDTSTNGAADSVAKLDKGLAEARQKVWKGRDIPFPVALARHHKIQYGPDIHETPTAKSRLTMASLSIQPACSSTARAKWLASSSRSPKPTLLS